MSRRSPAGAPPGFVPRGRARALPPGVVTLAFAVAGWLLIFLYALAQSRLGPRVGVALPDLATAFRSGLQFVALWVVVTPLILWSAARYPLSAERWKQSLPLHAALATALIVGSNALACATWLAAPAARLGVSWQRCTAVSVFAWFHYAFLFYFLIVALGQLGVWASERRDHRARAAELRAQLADARVQALQMQLQPHFLYNALNSVTGLVLTNRNDDAVELLTGLGDLLRQLLAPGAAHEIPLAEEMRFVESYLGIESARFSDRLRVSYFVEPALASALVPRFILQPLVENAIRHGIAPSARGGLIEVAASSAGGRLRLRVSDDGVGVAVAEAAGTRGHGTGIDNTRRRLAHLYGERGTLTISPRDGGGTDAVVECPYRTCSSEVRRPA